LTPSGSSSVASSRSLIPIVVLTLVWGCNWPILKLGVTEMPPLTFRAYTVVFAAIGLLAIAKLSGESLRIPRELWPRVAVLAILNISAWNGLLLFGVQQMPAGRSAILAYTMPVWATLVSVWVLRERLSPRKILGLALGMAGMATLLADDLAMLRGHLFGALMILGAAIIWSFGTVLLRKWKPAVPQNTLTGWMMVIGWVPIALCAPILDPDWLAAVPTLSKTAWFAIVYNIVLAGTLAHWAWFTLARTLPVAVSSMSSLPVPVVGVFAGILVLGERPGPAEWLALVLVICALVAVLWPDRNAARPSPAAPATPDD
jgi:drug/metabolite transporter (DMT)-like permease